MPEFDITIQARGRVEADTLEDATTVGHEQARVLADAAEDWVVRVDETELLTVQPVQDGKASNFHTIRPWNFLTPQNMGEDTLLAYPPVGPDTVPVRVGDVVRKACDNDEVHGPWVDYLVDKAPGGYVLRYIRSDKGWVLPLGYTAGNLMEHAMEETSLKMVVFSMRPLVASELTFIGRYRAEDYEHA